MRVTEIIFEKGDKVQWNTKGEVHFGTVQHMLGYSTVRLLNDRTGKYRVMDARQLTKKK